MSTHNSWLAAASLFVSASAFAQNGAQTIVLMPEGAELPAAVTRTIELPKNESGEYIPAAAGVENSAGGLAIANEARENGRAFGEAMAAQARENREASSRGGRPDSAGPPPGQLPDPVPLPSLPGPPATPPPLPEQPGTPPGRP